MACRNFVNTANTGLITGLSTAIFRALMLYLGQFIHARSTGRHLLLYQASRTIGREIFLCCSLQAHNKHNCSQELIKHKQVSRKSNRESSLTARCRCNDLRNGCRYLNDRPMSIAHAFFIQYKSFTKTRYLRLYLQTTGLHNKDVEPGKQEPMTIPKGHYMKH